MKPTGFILEKKRSILDGSPIVVILLVNSTNRKTGNMCQVYILREDINPVEAVNTGQDFSVCGDCPHRKDSHTGKRTCYVNVGQGPNSVWNAYKRGRYVDLTDPTRDLTSDLNQLDNCIRNKKIRWGAYGDPALINPKTFDYVNSRSQGHTAYTHQWHEQFASVYRGKMQASVDSMQQFIHATDNGWKTFIVGNYLSKKPKVPAITCPATLATSKTTCGSCTLCDGSSQHVFVHAHGASKSAVTFQ